MWFDWIFYVCITLFVLRMLGYLVLSIMSDLVPKKKARRASGRKKSSKNESKTKRKTGTYN